MTATTEIEWLHETDYPASPTPTDLKEFFGIPPAPDTDNSLNENIREKRKLWRGKSAKSRTDEARKRADAVLNAIAEAEDSIKRGAASDGARSNENQFDADPSVLATLDDVWRRIEMLLFRGRHQEALDAVKVARDRFEQDPRFLDMRAMVVLEFAQSGPHVALPPGLLAQAIADARAVLEALPRTEAHYSTLIELLEFDGRSSEAATVYEHATTELKNPSPGFRVGRLRLMLPDQDWPRILHLAVDLVKQSLDDRALRSEIVQLLIKGAASTFMPLDDLGEIVTYRNIVETAAWIADGVPEAEDFVRPHRMWASNSDQAVFAGDWQWRAFWGLITGFVALPILNGLKSRPAWKIVLEGPGIAQGDLKPRARKRADRAWFLVTNNSYLETAHEDIQLPWQNAAGQWPDLDIVFET